MLRVITAKQYNRIIFTFLFFTYLYFLQKNQKVL